MNRERFVVSDEDKKRVRVRRGYGCTHQPCRAQAAVLSLWSGPKQGQMYHPYAHSRCAPEHGKRITKPKSPKMGHTPCDLASDARYWTHYNTTHPCTSYLSLKTVIRLPRVTTKACGALTIEKLSVRGENRYYPPQQPGGGQTGTKISLAPSHLLPECSPDMYKS